MKRFEKAVLLPIRSIAYRRNKMRLYYWAEMKLYDLRVVNIMPSWYYRCLYHTCMWLVSFKNFNRLADRAIHTIPYHLRFEMA